MIDIADFVVLWIFLYIFFSIAERLLRVIGFKVSRFWFAIL